MAVEGPCLVRNIIEQFDSNYVLPSPSFLKTACRLCSKDSGPHGVCIFSGGEDGLCTLINRYLHIKVSEEESERYPRHICRDCHESLLRTVEFLQLVRRGQQALHRLLNTDRSGGGEEGGGGGGRPTGGGDIRRKRGRPRKIQPLPAEAEVETAAPPATSPQLLEQSAGVTAGSHLSQDNTSLHPAVSGRRTRKLPNRFASSVQGDDLERLFLEEGLLLDNSQDRDLYTDLFVRDVDGEVIGKVESNVPSGEEERLGGGGEELLVWSEAAREQADLLEQATTKPPTSFRCHCGEIFHQEAEFLGHLRLHRLMGRKSMGRRTGKGGEREGAGGGGGGGGEATSQRRHPCGQCDRSFKFNSSLAYHRATVHGDGRRYVCHFCSRAFRHKQLLKKHQLVHSSHRSVSCSECQAKFKTRKNQIKHYQSVHLNIKPFKCDICCQSFAHQTSLRTHLRRHNNDRPFSCTVCPKRFTQKGNLQEHMRIHTGEKPYACTVCGRRFTTSSQHKLHEKRHSSERPHFCSYCAKSFLNKTTYDSHLRRHSGVKPYECASCERSFADLWALKKHSRLHSGEKPYRCGICDKTFADASNLSKHKKSHKKLSMAGAGWPHRTLRGEVAPAKTADETGGQDMTRGVVPLTSTPSQHQQLGGGQDLEEQAVFYLSYQETPTMPPSVPANEVLSREKLVEACAAAAAAGDIAVTEDLVLQVVDQLGNPIFTFQDGTQLEVTSESGSLGVRLAESQGTARLPSVAPLLSSLIIPSLTSATSQNEGGGGGGGGLEVEMEGLVEAATAEFLVYE